MLVPLGKHKLREIPWKKSMHIFCWCIKNSIADLATPCSFPWTNISFWWWRDITYHTKNRRAKIIFTLFFVDFVRFLYDFCIKLTYWKYNSADKIIRRIFAWKGVHIWRVLFLKQAISHQIMLPLCRIQGILLLLPGINNILNI